MHPSACPSELKQFSHQGECKDCSDHVNGFTLATVDVDNCLKPVSIMDISPPSLPNTYTADIGVQINDDQPYCFICIKVNTCK